MLSRTIIVGGFARLRRPGRSARDAQKVSERGEVVLGASNSVSNRPIWLVDVAGRNRQSLPPTIHRIAGSMMPRKRRIGVVPALRHERARFWSASGTIKIS